VADATRRPEAPLFEVIEPGLLTSVQDLGRPGFRRFGVTLGGALDTASLRAANRALGNPDDAAGLECAIAGPTLRFLRSARFAIAGADLGAHLDRADLGRWPVPSVSRCRRVRATGYAAGAAVLPRHRACAAASMCRALGSRSTDLLGGFGGYRGRALKDGDVLSLGRPPRGGAPAARARGRGRGGRGARRPGPQDDHFDPASPRCWRRRAGTCAAPTSRAAPGRPRLAHAGAEIVSDGMLPGCIQVPPDSQPILMLADAPTTGGPRIAACCAPMAPRAARARPQPGPHPAADRLDPRGYFAPANEGNARLRMVWRPGDA
jgi:allophanate hydrolase subunit 2